MVRKANSACAARGLRQQVEPTPLGHDDTSGLAALTAVESAARIANGELLSHDLVGACLDRIADLESSIQAWAFLDRDRALEQARVADAQHKESKGTGPLHGVPVGLKDIVDTADMRGRAEAKVKFQSARPCDRLTELIASTKRPRE